MTATELEIFANATNYTSNDNEKQEVRKKLLLAKTRTVRILYCIKKGVTNAWCENVITNVVSE